MEIVVDKIAIAQMAAKYLAMAQRLEQTAAWFVAMVRASATVQLAVAAMMALLQAGMLFAAAHMTAAAFLGAAAPRCPLPLCR